MGKREIVTLRYEGEEADRGELNLYDSAVSLSGLGQAIGRILHAFVNKNIPQKRGAHPLHAEVYHKAAKKGCFEQIIEVEFEDKIVAEMGRRLVVWNFWDYLEYTIATAIGEEMEPQTEYVRTLAESENSPFEEIAETVEEGLKKLHRPILQKSVLTASFVRKEIPVVTFNAASAEYVDTSNLNEELEHFIGQVTRYNLNTGHGRAYIDDLRRIVPFKIPEFEMNEIAHRAATASMYDKANRLGGERKFVAQRITNAPGITKRLVVQEIHKLE